MNRNRRIDRKGENRENELKIENTDTDTEAEKEKDGQRDGIERRNEGIQVYTGSHSIDKSQMKLMLKLLNSS